VVRSVPSTPETSPSVDTYSSIWRIEATFTIATCWEGDRLVAVIDWEGSRPGDRAFDLVTFCFGFTQARATRTGLEERVWERACAATGSDALAAYVAHMALLRLDWSIRHHPDEVEALIDLVDRYMALVG
jgi:aminoglycoside phosphotransferase (APT) family kinase protein